MPWYSSWPIPPADTFATKLPEPRFKPGDVVRTIPGEVNRCVVKTELVAPVTWYSWHFKWHTWMYQLARRRRPRRTYYEAQLTPAPPDAAG